VAELRVGFGIDMHPFADLSDPVQAARPLMLGGVHFPGERGLVGNSDADALAHAIGDALLGAAGLGDLGRYFPGDDVRFSGADSIELLKACLEHTTAAGWRVTNADCTIVAEGPRIGPRREEMERRLAETIGAPVNVKATTPEGLGALGRLEGISCLAVVLLER
jgi:2-C-methyl-D-erythritol 2,4-cyclodiphosphate synthase